MVLEVNENLYLYEQVMEEIRRRIEDGTFEKGDKIPSEFELGELLGVSRITVRRAMKELIEEGDLEVRRGIGTFVTREKNVVKILDFNGFTDGIHIQPNYLEKILVSKNIIASDEKWEAIFEREEPFKILELIRLIRLEDESFSVDMSYFPLDLYSGIYDKIGDNVSTFKLIRNDYGIHFKRASKQIDLVYTDDELNSLFQQRITQPLYRIQKQIWNNKSEVCHYSHYYLIPDRVVIQFDVVYS